MYVSVLCVSIEDLVSHWNSFVLVLVKSQNIFERGGYKKTNTYLKENLKCTLQYFTYNYTHTSNYLKLYQWL